MGSYFVAIFGFGSFAFNNGFTCFFESKTVQLETSALYLGSEISTLRNGGKGVKSLFQNIKKLFLKRAILSLFFIYFQTIQTNNTNFTTN